MGTRGGVWLLNCVKMLWDDTAGQKEEKIPVSG